MTNISNSLYSSHYQNPITLKTSESYSNQDSKITLPSDEEILNTITNQVRFYQQTKKAQFGIDSNAQGYTSSITLNKQDINFKNQIENKLKSNADSNITQRDAEQAQKFLYAQMDNVMLTLYKENPELMQNTMDKNHQLCENGKFLDTEDDKLTAILLGYSAKTEKLEKGLSDYLGDNIETKEIREIQNAVNIYRSNKMEATGYGFFATVADKLSPELQEQIANAISKVITFYSEPNSIEINGAKISWKPHPYTDTNGSMLYHSTTYTACADVEIKYQKDFNKTNSDMLASLSSNFDSTQNFFDILEKRDKLEKENQELKTKQAYSAYGISNTTNSIKTDSTSDSIMQTLLKDSKENKTLKV
ncbi:hypothetical protein LS70_009720 [Helicobacter sp. MIT 11-5569]|uniref:hypothetical protein n=1 Tax=Helicobacter sp. MIT 11-5569 TaxID=1548151 RepID=UPI00051FF018|nr:hypothetical protein [Helicobacter sp. MIT 11-5569]TLD79710.1 hypothetical protein LS70_009720 [Helicobacter sp. MIT 11-5569]